MFSALSQYLRNIITGGTKIFGGALGSGLVTAYQHGEVKDYHALFSILADATLPATVMTLIWLFMRSPKDDKEIHELRRENMRLRVGLPTPPPISEATARG